MWWIDAPYAAALRRAFYASVADVQLSPDALYRIRARIAKRAVRALSSKKPAASSPPRAEDPHPLKGTES